MINWEEDEMDDWRATVGEYTLEATLYLTVPCVWKIWHKGEVITRGESKDIATAKRDAELTLLGKYNK